MLSESELNDLWEISKEEYKIQQIPEEWLWMINQTVNTWDYRKNIFEIGCYDGGSSRFLSRFAENMTTIDNHSPARFDTTTLDPKCNYLYIGGDSHDPKVIQNVSEQNWDFAFIDGDHSYEGVRADFQNVLPYLKKGTPVVFHDIVISDFHHQHGCYVGEFWEDLKKEYDATRFDEIKTNPEWAGIGIVFV